MKQSEYKNIKECQKDIIYPIYKDQDICKGLIETLGSVSYTHRCV